MTRIEDIRLQYTGKPEPLGWRWIATFESYDGPAHRISNRKGSGSWETVATLNCEFSLAELSTHEISET